MCSRWLELPIPPLFPRGGAAGRRGVGGRRESAYALSAEKTLLPPFGLPFTPPLGLVPPLGAAPLGAPPARA